jgi:hypothetical protein
MAIDETYDRERQALYLAQQYPDDLNEAQALHALVGKLLPFLDQSRQQRKADQAD